jgi:hypothetical protein
VVVETDNGSETTVIATCQVNTELRLQIALVSGQDEESLFSEELYEDLLVQRSKSIDMSYQG